MSATTPLLCINCQYYNPGRPLKAGEQTAALCGHPRHGVDLVDGTPIRPTCRQERTSGGCGFSALHFEARRAESVAGAEVPQ